MPQKQFYQALSPETLKKKIVFLKFFLKIPMVLLMGYFKIILLGVALLASFQAQAELFHNSYISFEIPKNWMCKPFDATWVCHSKLARKQKEAVIVMVAKEAGALDNLTQYQTFLKNQRDVKQKGKDIILKSKVIHVKQKLIHSQPWVDGLHRGSEVPTYFTRYLVTKCCNKSAIKLGILVTLSSQKDHHTKYANDFLKVINSLRVMDLNKTLRNLKSFGKGENMGQISKYIEEIVAGSEDDINPEGEGGLLFGLDGMALSALGLSGLIAFLLLMRRLRKPKLGKKRSSKNRKKP